MESLTYKDYLANLEEPCESEVRKYCNMWNESNGEYKKYVIHEKIIKKLFIDPNGEFTKNKNFEDVLLKVTVLNSFYSTNIFDVYTVAQHICDLNIDKELENSYFDYIVKNKESNLVEKMRHVSMKKDDYDFYSFTTKYCSCHRSDLFPIYDSLVDDVLWAFNKKEKFYDFKRKEIKNYSTFCTVLKVFQEKYKLEKFSLKEIDKYLWTISKNYKLKEK